MKALLLLGIGTITAGIAWPVLKSTASNIHPQAVVDNLKGLVTVNNSGNSDNTDTQDSANKFASAAAQSSMPADDLRRNLGEPVRIFRNDDAQTVYYYPTVYVVINNGRVIGSYPVMINGVPQSNVVNRRLTGVPSLGLGSRTHIISDVPDLQPGNTTVPSFPSTSFPSTSSLQGGSLNNNGVVTHSSFTNSSASSGSARVWSSAPHVSAPAVSSSSGSKWSH